MIAYSITYHQAVRHEACGPSLRLRAEDTQVDCVVYPDEAREVVAHIAAQDQRIQELEAVLTALRGVWGPDPEHFPPHPNFRVSPALLDRIDALLGHAPPWPTISGGVQ